MKIAHSSYKYPGYSTGLYSRISTALSVKQKGTICTKRDARALKHKSTDFSVTDLQGISRQIETPARP